MICYCLTSCAVEEREIQSPNSKVLSNRSGHTVTVTYSSSSDAESQGTFEILDTKDTTLVGYCETGFSSGLPCIIGWIEDEHTSLRVTFDDLRYTDYQYSDCWDEAITLLAKQKIAELCGYEYIGVDDQNGRTYKWTFTPEDYDNAKPF